MGVFNERLWLEFENKARIDDDQRPQDCRIANAYVEEVKKLCKYGIDRSKTIRDTFPLYTLHDETHIVNVVRLMWDLLGTHIDKLTCDELAMLILAACCHDIGMSYKDSEREAVLNDKKRLLRYLENNKSEYVKAFSAKSDTLNLTEAMKQNYLRSIHHERAAELLHKVKWPGALQGRIIRKDLIAVCQSHGKDVSALSDLRHSTTIDLRFCAILLRLADILDFDAKRAPQAIYEYCDFANKDDEPSKYSEKEWIKHLSSNGFDFHYISDRSYPYELNYNATCRSMQIEQAIRDYLNWVDEELSVCRQQLDCYVGRHRDFVLPRKIKRYIEPDGYMSGEYRLTLDQDQVMDLLVGRNLYQDPAVFVRELLQNAIDAVRTREKLDHNLPADWKPQINISSWMDMEGYHWFRIEDNGIGMTEQIIREFFLKIGRSYYNSDEFLEAKIRCKADANYMPISRFGIGILSCFMGDEQTNLVEISTKHFDENGEESPSLRMQMSGVNGYYYLASSEDYHNPGEMRGRSDLEKVPYLRQAGTAIAVRTNLYRNGKYKGFKEIVDRYVVYPSVPIHYDGDEGSFDYPTEDELINTIYDIRYSDDVRELGLLEFPLSDNQISEIQDDIPNIIFNERPKLRVKCAPLGAYTETSYMLGAILLIDVVGFADEIEVDIAGEKVKADVDVSVSDINEYYTDVIGVKVSLRFSDIFRDQIRLVEEKHTKLGQGGIDFRLFAKYESNLLLQKIVDAIIHGEEKDLQWREAIKQASGISTEELNLKIKQIRKEYHDMSGITPDDENAFKRLRAFNHMKKEWIFDLCNLRDYDWYNKYFLALLSSTEGNSIIAHNGIFCDKSELFYSREMWSAVILLKDKYRPTVDISRDRIRHLPLEAACDLEVLCNQLETEEFVLRRKRNLLDGVNYPYISVNEYISLLKNRPDFIRHFSFSTNKGKLSAELLDERIKTGECVEFTGCARLGNCEYERAYGHLYDYLCTAYLQSKYTLRIDMSRYNCKIFIENKTEDIYDEKLFAFPPAFFLRTCEETMFLTPKDAYLRKTCNASHRLSQFMINNAEKLQNKVPGIFWEILRSLAEDNAEIMIVVVNDLLERMKSLPNTGIEIPSDLELDIWDFN